MKISAATCDKLNQLLYLSFDCNAMADNFAYNIDFMCYPNIANIYHHSFAHLFPQLADEISDLMIKLDARPIRKATNSYDTQYFDLISIFKDSDTMTEKYRQAIKSTIDVADYNGDYEVRIALEDFLEDFLPYVKQSSVWARKAEEYKEKPAQFDVHFARLTPFIPIEESDLADD